LRCMIDRSIRTQTNKNRITEYRCIILSVTGYRWREGQEYCSSSIAEYRWQRRDSKSESVFAEWQWSLSTSEKVIYLSRKDKRIRTLTSDRLIQKWIEYDHKFKIEVAILRRSSRMDF
jgi:hypothetical protein